VNRKFQQSRIFTALLMFVMPAVSQNFFAYSAEKAPANVKLTHPEVPRISATELAQLLEKRADIVIGDTQSPDSYEMWHIPSAVNIPYISTANPTDRQLMLIGLPMEKLIVIYCLCEEGTDSAKMALELKQLGYSQENIKVLEGGLIQWDEKGYPMIKQEIAN
jgi:rhodanese-related sulfurtransferase